jgi:hypothetical protein
MALRARGTAYTVAFAFAKSGRRVKLSSDATLYYGHHLVATFKAGTRLAIGSVSGRVPTGAQVVVKLGKLKASFAMPNTGRELAVLVNSKAARSVVVTTASGLKPTDAPSASDPNGGVEDEKGDGDPTKIEINGGTLPDNLPFTIALTCTTMTLAPQTGQVFSSLRFEEDVEDGGNGFKYEGAFDGSLDVPYIVGSEVKIRLFQNDQQSLEIEAPLSAFGTPSDANGAACPTPAPSASPSAEPSDSPSAEPSESPSAEPTD